MKKFTLAVAAFTALIFSANTFALEALGWRLAITTSIANDTPITISEVEWLHDDDDDSATARVDGTSADLGATECGWTATKPNFTDDEVAVAVPCDSASSNQRPDSVPANTRRNRAAKVVFDDNYSTEFQTRRTINNGQVFYVQYIWYVGSQAPGRTLPDVEAYSVTVPTDVVDTYAPSVWTVEYLDRNSGQWTGLPDDAVSAANFNDGTAVTSGGSTVGYKLTFTLN